MAILLVFREEWRGSWGGNINIISLATQLVANGIKLRSTGCGEGWVRLG